MQNVLFSIIRMNQEKYFLKKKTIFHLWFLNDGDKTRKLELAILVIKMVVVVMIVMVKLMMVTVIIFVIIILLVIMAGVIERWVL